MESNNSPKMGLLPNTASPSMSTIPIPAVVLPTPPTPPTAQKKVRTTRPVGSSPSGIPTYRIKTRFSDKTRKYKVASSNSNSSSKHRDATVPAVPVLNIPTSRSSSSKPNSRPSTAGAATRQDEDEEAYILVMGPSGAGKTSFINLASDSQLPVSSGLGSCTSAVSISEPFTLDGQRVRLIDTPGFDDSSKSDGDVLATIAEFLAKEFIRGKRLRSVLYFHRISDVRMGAVARKNFVMFQKMCGAHAYPNVVVVTTRWNEVNTLVAEGRESELKTKTAFFKSVLEAGGQMIRYAGAAECTRRILRAAMGCPSVILAIQKQMVLEKKTVGETDAGMRLQVEKMDQIEKYKDALTGLVQEIEVLRAGNDTDGLRGVEGDVKELKEKVRELQAENQRLLSRQNSDSWELVSETEERVSSSSESDEDPHIIGGLPAEPSVESLSWSEWVLSLHPSLFNLVSNVLALVSGRVA